jgi:hypothetical protein
MAASSTFVFIILALATLQYASATGTCTSDSDCTSGQGACVQIPSSANFGCACYSGFASGDSETLCSVKPPSSCLSSYDQVNSSITQFHPVASVKVANDTFFLTLTAELDQSPYVDPTANTLNAVDPNSVAYAEQTTISFGGSSPACNYPSTSSTPVWQKPALTSGNCFDDWSLSLNLASAVTQCGFEYDASSKLFTQDVTITRVYSLPWNVPEQERNAKRDVLLRNESETFSVALNFPSEVSVATNVNVTGPHDVFISAIVLLNYTDSSNTWKVQIQTYTAAPYKLSAPIISADGEINADGRLAGSTTIQNLGPCNSNSEGCAQLITTYLSGCNALSGDIFANVTPVCSGAIGNTCPAIDSTSLIRATVNTDNSCQAVATINVQTLQLTPFHDNTLQLAQVFFHASDIAYFGAHINSTDAIIATKTLEYVCMIFNPTHTNSDRCINVTFATIASTNGKDPAFSINLAETRAFTQSISTETFEVVATVGLTWSDAPISKRQLTIRSSNSANVNPSALVGINNEDKSTTAAANDLSPKFIAISVILGLLSLFM